jgi:hypothetical protein
MPCYATLSTGGYAAELHQVNFTSANASHLYQLQEWADLQVGEGSCCSHPLPT